MQKESGGSGSGNQGERARGRARQAAAVEMDVCPSGLACLLPGSQENTKIGHFQGLLTRFRFPPASLCGVFLLLIPRRLLEDRKA